MRNKVKMSENSNFYLTLMSNSSFATYPENKTSSFTVDLSRNIDLHGKWDVALVEMHYPNVFENVMSGNTKIVVTWDVLYDINFETGAMDIKTEKKVFEIPIGYYASTLELIEGINTTIKTSLGIANFLRLDKDDGRVVVTARAIRPFKKKILHEHSGRKEFDVAEGDDVDVGRKTALKYWVDDLDMENVLKAGVFKEDTFFNMKMTLEGRLALQMGFEPDSCIVSSRARTTPQVSFGIPAEMLIYCDLIEPQLYGHSLSKIIRTVVTLDPNSRFGDMCQRCFPIRNYVPLMKNNFKTVSIDIRAANGVLMPFNFGNSHVLLHFIKRENN